MKTIVTLSTKAAKKSGGEMYYDETLVVCVICTNGEREEFERSQTLAGCGNCSIDADVLPPALFSVFSSWLMSNAKLTLQSVGH